MSNKDKEEYRFVFCPAIGLSQTPFYGDSVSSLELAEGQLNIIANYTLHLHNENLMQDYSNVGYIEKYIDDDWEEIEEV
ncbi:MAG: hypothetical protein KAT04_15430 [Methylococcales bacterium]|nr:hypothetical protein [Methylococcales bacterium]